MRLLRTRPGEIPADLDMQVHALLRGAFPDAVGARYDYGQDAPELIVLLLHDQTVVGHLAAYSRQVLIGSRPATIGLIGGVAVDAARRRRGHAKAMLAAAHDDLRSRAITFSVLFAIEPAAYRSTGYRRMRNKTRFLDHDGLWKDYVYRGGMVAELADERWRHQHLDLMGPTV